MTQIERIDKKIAELKAKRKELVRHTPRKYLVKFQAIEHFEFNNATYHINSHFITNSLESDSITNRLNRKYYLHYTMKIYERKSHKLIKEYQK